MNSQSEENESFQISKTKGHQRTSDEERGTIFQLRKNVPLGPKGPLQMKTEEIEKDMIIGSSILTF